MANTTVADTDIGAYNKTLTADTVDTITFADASPDTADSTDAVLIEVGSKDGADEIWITTNGNDPTVNGPGCYYLPAIAGAVREIPMKGGTTLKLKSAGTPTYWFAKL